MIFFFHLIQCERGHLGETAPVGLATVGLSWKVSSLALIFSLLPHRNYWTLRLMKSNDQKKSGKTSLFCFPSRSTRHSKRLEEFPLKVCRTVRVSFLHLKSKIFFKKIPLKKVNCSVNCVSRLLQSRSLLLANVWTLRVVDGADGRAVCHATCQLWRMLVQRSNRTLVVVVPQSISRLTKVGVSSSGSRPSFSWGFDGRSFTLTLRDVTWARYLPSDRFLFLGLRLEKVIKWSEIIGDNRK